MIPPGHWLAMFIVVDKFAALGRAIRSTLRILDRRPKKSP